MSPTTAALVALLTATAASALPAHAAQSLHLVAGPEAAKVLGERAVHARLGTRVRLCAVLRARLRGRLRSFSDARRPLRIGRRLLRPAQQLPFSALGQPLTWRWYRVEPRPHHVETQPPNAGNPAYSNAVLFGPRHGTWLGYDTIEYKESPVAGATSSCIVISRTHPSHPKVNVNHGLGTMRYKVELSRGDVVLATAGAEARTRRGISPRVLRVTFRADDSFLGRLRGYFNVPNVFGSAGYGRRHQTELYQGADCADVIIGAARRAGARIPYTSVLGLRRVARPVSDRLLMTAEGLFRVDAQGEKTPVTLHFGREVQPGDLLLIDYAKFQGSPRSWDHVAVVGGDGGTHGILDPADPVLHMGYLYGLTEEPALSQAPAWIKLLRFKRSVRRAMRPRHRARGAGRSSAAASRPEKSVASARLRPRARGR